MSGISTKTIIDGLLCDYMGAEPDNMGCDKKKCRYRDPSDGACDVVKMCLDAAERLKQLATEYAAVRKERDAAVRDLYILRRCETCRHRKKCEASDEYKAECINLTNEYAPQRLLYTWRSVWKEDV